MKPYLTAGIMIFSFTIFHPGFAAAEDYAPPELSATTPVKSAVVPTTSDGSADTAKTPIPPPLEKMDATVLAKTDTSVSTVVTEGVVATISSTVPEGEGQAGHPTRQQATEALNGIPAAIRPYATIRFRDMIPTPDGGQVLVNGELTYQVDPMPEPPTRQQALDALNALPLPVRFHTTIRFRDKITLPGGEQVLADQEMSWGPITNPDGQVTYGAVTTVLPLEKTATEEIKADVPSLPEMDGAVQTITNRDTIDNRAVHTSIFSTVPEGQGQAGRLTRQQATEALNSIPEAIRAFYTRIRFRDMIPTPDGGETRVDGQLYYVNPDRPPLPEAPTRQQALDILNALADSVSFNTTIVFRDRIRRPDGTEVMTHEVMTGGGPPVTYYGLDQISNYDQVRPGDKLVMDFTGEGDEPQVGTIISAYWGAGGDSRGTIIRLRALQVHLNTGGSLTIYENGDVRFDYPPPD